MSTSEKHFLTQRQMFEQEVLALDGELPKGYLDLLQEIAPTKGTTRLTSADDRKLLDRLIKEVHAKANGCATGAQARPRAALCLSGGGIRSATFALGALQGLAKYGLLTSFDYLSTVSGGGYVGSWLTAWVHRDPDGLVGVEHKLAVSAGRSLDRAKVPMMPARRARSGPEAPELRHLREYSSYLTPRLGILSLDSWTLLAIYLRNLALMWLMLMPLLACLFALPRVYLQLLLWRPVDSLGAPWGQAFAWTLKLLAIAMTIMGVVAAVSASPRMGPRHLPRRRAHQPREQQPPKRPSRPSSRTVATAVILPVFLSAFVVSVIRAWLPDPQLSYRALLLWCAGMYSAAAFLTRFVVWRQGSSDPARVSALLLVLNLAGTASGFIAWSTHSSHFIGWVNTADATLTSMCSHAVLVVPFILSLYFLVATVYIGLTSGQAAGDADREWWARLSGAIVFLALSWLSITGISLFGPIFLHNSLAWAQRFVRREAILASGATVTVALVMLGIAGGHVAASRPIDVARSVSAWARIRSLIPSISAPLALLVVALAISCGVDRLLKQWAGSTALSVAPHEHLAAVPQSGVVLLRCLGFAAVCLLLSLIAGRTMNSNRLSLHGMYRDRLIRAFLGASNSRLPDPFTGFDERDNLPMHYLRRALFTPTELQRLHGPDKPRAVEDLANLLRWRRDGFWDYVWDRVPHVISRITDIFDQATKTKQPLDVATLEKLVLRALNRLLRDPFLYQKAEAGIRAKNPEIVEALLALHKDHHPFMLNRLILEEVCQVDERKLLKMQNGSAYVPRPLQICNMALNLVEGKNLAWQQRKARSFTVTPLHCGFDKGYRPAYVYGGPITMGTAMTISGAAATPNMGYHSSPAVTFLLTLFNVRLGWWLGNPARRSGNGNELFRLADPKQSIQPLIDEAAGRTDDESAYVYLSDGGHFENLGLYEAVRRRCHVIVVCDASYDPECKFQDLANAIRKIQIDFGISINFDRLPEVVHDGKYCAFGRIRYDAVDGRGVPEGQLIYIKPSRHEDEAVDVYNQRLTVSSFPNEPTSNQWFGEPQFESYRKLGLETVEAICRMSGPSDALDVAENLTLKEFGEAARVAAGLRKRSTVHRQASVHPKGQGLFTRVGIAPVPEAIGVYMLKNQAGEILLIATALGHGLTLYNQLKSRLDDGALAKDAHEYSYQTTSDAQAGRELETKELDEYRQKHNGEVPSYNR